MGGCVSKTEDKVQSIPARSGADRPGPAPPSPNGKQPNGGIAADGTKVFVLRDPDPPAANGNGNANAGAGANGTAAATASTTTAAAATNAAIPAAAAPVVFVDNTPYHGGRGSNGKRNATFAILGLNNAGKTTVGNNIKGSPSDYVFPTMGFDLDDDIVHGNFNVKLYGLGGDEKIRGYWANYYDDLHGVIFVVDAADTARLALVKQVLAQVAADHRITGKPILVFANKQDLPGALTDVEIATHIGLNELSQCPHHITKCVALVPAEADDESDADKAKRRPPDPNIPKGLLWLLSTLDANFRTVNERVERDLAARKVANQKQAEEKRRQVEQWRKEEEEAAARKAAEAANPTPQPAAAPAPVASAAAATETPITATAPAAAGAAPSSAGAGAGATAAAPVDLIVPVPAGGAPPAVAAGATAAPAGSQPLPNAVGH